MDSQHDGFEAGGVYVAEADDRIEELTLPGWLEHVTHVVVEGVGGDYDNVGWVVGFIEGGWMELREGHKALPADGTKLEPDFGYADGSFDLHDLEY